MHLASKLKKENICEYLIFMWQIEDVIRASGLNIDVLNQQFVSGYSSENEQERKTLSEWYESLIEMMRLEGVQERGHLQINKNVLIDLLDVHALLIQSGKVPAYNAKFYHILPYITQLRAKSDASYSDLEICFNFMYGIMLLKMKKAEISVDTTQAFTEISKYLVLLAKNYNDYQNGDLDLYD